jgi:hypothetical protein
MLFFVGSGLGKASLLYLLQRISDGNYQMRAIAEAAPRTIGCRYSKLKSRGVATTAPVFATPVGLDLVNRGLGQAEARATICDTLHPCLTDPKKQGAQQLTGAAVVKACSPRTRHIFFNRVGKEGKELFQKSILEALEKTRRPIKAETGEGSSMETLGVLSVSFNEIPMSNLFLNKIADVAPNLRCFKTVMGGDDDSNKVTDAKFASFLRKMDKVNNDAKECVVPSVFNLFVVILSVVLQSVIILSVSNQSVLHVSALILSFEIPSVVISSGSCAFSSSTRPTAIPGISGISAGKRLQGAVVPTWKSCG